jgi:hypothetical protein
MVTNCARCITKSSRPDSVFCDGCLEAIKRFYADAAEKVKCDRGEAWLGREYGAHLLPQTAQYNDGLEHAARIAVAQLTPPNAATPEGVAAAIRAAKVGRVECSNAPHHDKWQCKADRSGIGGNTPQDCDWPCCGCDPYADKVIAALQESGKLP